MTLKIPLLWFRDRSILDIPDSRLSSSASFSSAAATGAGTSHSNAMSVEDKLLREAVAQIGDQ